MKQEGQGYQEQRGQPWPRTQFALEPCETPPWPQHALRQPVHHPYERTEYPLYCSSNLTYHNCSKQSELTQPEVCLGRAQLFERQCDLGRDNLFRALANGRIARSQISSQEIWKLAHDFLDDCSGIDAAHGLRNALRTRFRQARGILCPLETNNARKRLPRAHF